MGFSLCIPLYVPPHLEARKLEKGLKELYSIVMNIRILFLGEIVGRPGIHAIRDGLKILKKEKEIDFVVANGEGTTNGFGIGKNHALQLLKIGVDLITTGEKTYFKKDMVEHIAKNGRIIRPANYPAGNPGRGYRIVEIKGKKVGFIVLLGNSDFPRTHLGNPYLGANALLERMKSETDAICIQFHASTTAEKQTMAHHVDGRASAMIGTHTKVLTSDARILPHGTAMITDNGRCGSPTGVGGFDASTEIERFLTQIPSRSQENWGKIELQGVIVDINESGKATNIELVKEQVKIIEDKGAS
jgi:metallophosphoesterase (TIGR00282 family)